MAQFKVTFYHHPEPEFEVGYELIEADDVAEAMCMFWDSDVIMNHDNIEFDRVEEV